MTAAVLATSAKTKAKSVSEMSFLIFPSKLAVQG